MESMVAALGAAIARLGGAWNDFRNDTSDVGKLNCPDKLS